MHQFPYLVSGQLKYDTERTFKMPKNIVAVCITVPSVVDFPTKSLYSWHLMSIGYIRKFTHKAMT